MCNGAVGAEGIKQMEGINTRKIPLRMASRTDIPSDEG